uniref:RAP domain-containing protein n=1 Tax=Endozoicomonas sp. ALC013 TaxID=3403076 RepID=UPI003BB81100
HGLELEITPKLKQVVAALLPHVTSKAESKEQKDRFIPQHIANLVWALAKLVDNGLELEKTAKLKEALATLLYHVKTKAESKEERDRFKPQGVANLLWALAKLVDNGLELEKTAKLKETLAALLYHVKTTAESKEERDHFNTQGTVNLLWAMAKLGEAIELNLVKSMFGSLADRISETPQLSLQNTWMSLWGAMVFCARLYLYFGRDNKNPLEKHIGELFSRLGNTSPKNIEAQTVIAMAASWLGRPCPVVPYYQTIISQSQSTFCEQLRLSLPSLKIEEEKSLNSLPPVDLQLPDYNTVIDVQGPSHYVSGDFKIRNGSTLLKVALLKKLGFEVIEIPVNKLGNQDSMKIVIEQIKEKLAALPEAHGSVSLSSGEWAADEAYFTADEGGQFSDDCYFTAEEYLEEQINKPKKRKRKRKKASKN